MESHGMFKLLAYASLVDGTLAESERAQLENFASWLKIDAATASQLIEEARKLESFELPEGADPYDAFLDILDVVTADHELDDAEGTLLRQVGEKCGLSSEDIEQRIAEALKRSD